MYPIRDMRLGEEHCEPTAESTVFPLLDLLQVKQSLRFNNGPGMDNALPSELE